LQPVSTKLVDYFGQVFERAECGSSVLCKFGVVSRADYFMPIHDVNEIIWHFVQAVRHGKSDARRPPDTPEVLSDCETTKNRFESCTNKKGPRLSPRP